jgi:hypothetical protein
MDLSYNPLMMSSETWQRKLKFSVQNLTHCHFVGFEVLTEVVTNSRLLGCACHVLYHWFLAGLIRPPQDEGDMFFRNVG